MVWEFVPRTYFGRPMSSTTHKIVTHTFSHAAWSLRHGKYSSPYLFFSMLNVIYLWPRKFSHTHLSKVLYHLWWGIPTLICFAKFCMRSFFGNYAILKLPASFLFPFAFCFNHFTTVLTCFNHQFNRMSYKRQNKWRKSKSTFRWNW